MFQSSEDSSLAHPSASSRSFPSCEARTVNQFLFAHFICGPPLVMWEEAEQLSPWEAPLIEEELLHRATVFFPPPELAKSNIVCLLEAWVESPQDTWAIFIVP